MPYVCSILPRSGKIKEYINIYEKPNIINLRNYLINQSATCNFKSNLDKELVQECLWGIDVFKEKINNPFDEFIIASAPIYQMWEERNE